MSAPRTRETARIWENEPSQLQARTVTSLKVKLQAKLDDPAGRTFRDGSKLRTPKYGSGVRKRQEIYLVEEIKELGPKLQTAGLRNCDILLNRQIPNV